LPPVTDPLVPLPVPPALLPPPLPPSELKLQPDKSSKAETPKSIA
jgi:hypothetical protein